MSSRLPTCLLRDRSSRALISVSPQSNAVTENWDLVRVLVIDDHPRTVEQIENALWVWPHRVTRTNSLHKAVKMCHHLTPTAILVSLEVGETERGRPVARLRRALPDIPIIALATPEVVANPGTILEQGANAILCREALQQPTLHDLLMRLQEPAENIAPAKVSDGIDIPFPWRDSNVFGSLICDIGSQIVGANNHLASLLGYASPGDLKGLSVGRDILCSSDDWADWKSVAGDTSKVLQQSTSIKSNNQQLLSVSIEAFALANSPTHIQAVFVDLSALTHKISSTDK